MTRCNLQNTSLKSRPWSIVVATWMVLTSACAQNVQLGQKLNAAERAQWAQGHAVRMEGEQFQVLTPQRAPQGADPQRETWVVNELGVVGLSRHEVLVAQVDTAAVQALVASGVLPSVLQESYNPSTRIATLRFASFAQAVQARAALAGRLPGASVTVPVQYQNPRHK